MDGRTNVDPRVWGPFFWRTIDFIIFGLNEQLTEKEKNSFFNFFMGFRHLLPCQGCRKNFKDKTKEYKKDRDAFFRKYNTKQQLMELSLNVENQVRAANKRPLLTMQDKLQRLTSLIEEQERNKEKFDNLYDRCKTNWPLIGSLCALAALAAAVVSWAVIRRRKK